MNEKPPVYLNQMRVSIRGRQIIHIDQLQIEPGEIVGILGPNGAGKSTLLKVLAGCLRPSEGQASVLGEDMSALSSWRLAEFRRRLGYAPQLPAMGGELPLTIREVVAIGRTGARGLFKRLTSSDWDSVELWIDRLGLSDVANAAYTETSGGQQRKAILARVMVQEPELLLLDEPTAHLDLGAREQIVQTIQQLQKDTHLPVVLVCHEVEVLPASCQRIVILNGGRVQADGPVDQVLTTATVSSLYGPGFHVLHSAGRYAALPQSGAWT